MNTQNNESAADETKQTENETQPGQNPHTETFAETDPGPCEESSAPGPEQQLEEMNDRYMRTLAEYDNFRKRTAREREALYTDIKARSVEAFLTVADNFERALETETSDKEYEKGIRMIFQKLTDTFTSLGVSEVGEVGERFDPRIHNAVTHVEDETFGEAVVCEVYQKGYKIGEKLLRPAMVKVAN